MTLISTSEKLEDLKLTMLSSQMSSINFEFALAVLMISRSSMSIFSMKIPILRENYKKETSLLEI